MAKWKSFELPTRILYDEKTSTKDYTCFHIEPFEAGFGTTIGNSLRRVLLSSIEGTAPTSVKIKGVAHEFSTIPGVKEDVVDIVLNVKKLIVKSYSDEVKILKISVKGKGEVKASHILPDPDIEIINPDILIATLVDDDAELDMEIKVKRGRGYITSEENRQEEDEIGVIPVDSFFSPVTRVNFKVENTRVGKSSKYDKLILEIWTNGTITPDMALVESAKILRKHLNPFVHYYEVGREMQLTEIKREETKKREKYLEELKRKLAMSISEFDLSVRATNCLESEGIKTLGELVCKPEEELLKMRNFGKTSLREVKRKLNEMGLTLGMDLEAIFGTTENVVQ